MNPVSINDTQMSAMAPGKSLSALGCAVLAALFLCPRAEARPRDDVMSGAFHCGAIADSRTWLDCYYGAAQPIRASLGMQSVPTQQLRLLSQPPEGGVVENGPLRDSVMTSAAGCADRSDDREWLTCYYSSALSMREKLGLPLATTDRHVPISNPVQGGATASGFGLPASPIHQAMPNRITSRLTAYSFNKFQIFIVTLENGQVWRQIPGDTIYAHWKSPPGAYTAIITHGLLGSFNFQISNLPGVYKVIRLS
jgi:hypothetical protein